MKELSRKVDAMEFDSLFADLTPTARVGAGVLRRDPGGNGLKRGAILARSSADGSLVPLGIEPPDGDTFTACGILCDDVTLLPNEEMPTAVYYSGCFNAAKLTTDGGYELTPEDIDALGGCGIVIKAVAGA